MKKYRYLAFLVCFSMLFIQAQNDCEDNLKQVKALLERTSPFGNQDNMLALIEPCIAQGHAEAENYLGLFYLNGIGTDKDITKAFAHISSAAHKGYANAQYNLGRLYKYGEGCDLSFTKAIEWFEKATANGNQRAAYTLGYMYYKGFGVEQDYQKAVHWFNRSTDPMAQHFLGICYYLGYGVTANESRALEILLANSLTVNSKTLVTYIQAAQKKKNEAAVAEVMQATTATDSTYIAPEAITDINIETYNDPLTKEAITGEWTGKLVQYDWSGNSIVRIIPIAIDFKTTNNKVHITTIINHQKQEANALWQDGNLYVENDLTFTLDKLYSSNPNELSLDYTVFTLSLEKKELMGNTYLTGFVDTFINSWSEYGQPMDLILKPKGAEEVIDEAMIAALAAQEDQFIKLYPVPFNEQLTVQYQLETAENVYVELISLNGSNKIVILPTTQQQAGDYTYTIPVSSTLPEGLYVVRLIAGGQLYTRMIVKDN